MAYMDNAASWIGANNIWNGIRKGWSVLRGAMKAGEEDREMARALKELAAFEDYQLHDIGLCRSDLTPEGLAVAGAWRSLKQAGLARELAGRGAEMKEAA